MFSFDFERNPLENDINHENVYNKVTQNDPFFVDQSSVNEQSIDDLQNLQKKDDDIH